MDETVLSKVEDHLKSRKKVYYLQRTIGEEGVNDYNPLLLYLWKSNIDVQYVADASLAISHYVTGYITKAEKSKNFGMISVSRSHCIRIMEFGIRSLRSHECDLYEEADILLGEYLYEKSDTVQWISVEKPENRKVRVKKYSKLQQLAELDPNSNDLYKDNLIDNFYPNRPVSLGEVCLIL